MAQSQSDFFDFVIQPNFDTKGLEKQSTELQGEFQKIAQRIYDDIQEAMGSAFKIPANVKRSSLNDVMELVTQIGGQVKRVGTTITATFKDADGVVRQTVNSINSSLTALESANAKILQTSKGQAKVDAYNLAEKIEKYRTSGATYSGQEQISQYTKEQNELEKNILSNLQEQYNLEKKITDAQLSGNQVSENYYTQLKNIASQEETRMQSEYKGSQENINALKQKLGQEEQLYKTRVLSQDIQNRSAQTERNNLKQSLELLNQYESIKSKIDAAETSGQKGSAYYQELETQLSDIIASMQAYGIEIDKTTGKLVFKDTATNAVKAKENINELNKELKETNANLDTQKAKAKDQTLINNIKEYVKQYQSLRSLESKGQQDTQAYKETQAAMQGLIQVLKQYGIEIQTDNNGTQQFVVVQKNAENQTDKVAEAIRGANVYLGTHTESQNKLITSIQQSVENFVKYQVAMEAINKLTSEFTSAIYDMNEAMTQVRMVTMGSYEDTVQLADSYTQLAKQLGTTTTTVAEGADTWLRQGYSAQEAMEMLKQSTTLAVVGQLDATSAVDQLTAITKSYNVAVEDTSNIVDKLVAVDLNYAAERL